MADKILPPIPEPTPTIDGLTIVLRKKKGEPATFQVLYEPDNVMPQSVDVLASEITAAQRTALQTGVMGILTVAKPKLGFV